jgi:Domain of unknown function (DUF397)
MADSSIPVWLRSSKCSANDCVEVAFVDDRVAVRDSKNRHGSVLVFAADEWRSFLDAARAGEFDLRSP